MNPLKAIRGLCRRAIEKFDKKKPLWNLKPEVQAAFELALAPVKRTKRPSPIGSQDSPRQWSCKVRFVTRLRPAGSMPRSLKRAVVHHGVGFTPDEAAAMEKAQVTPFTYRRPVAKPNTDMSPRQRRRAKSADLRAVRDELKVVAA